MTIKIDDMEIHIHIMMQLKRNVENYLVGETYVLLDIFEIKESTMRGKLKHFMNYERTVFVTMFIKWVGENKNY